MSREEMENLVDQTVVNLEREHDSMDENDWHTFLCFLIAELTIAIRVSHDPI